MSGGIALIALQVTWHNSFKSTADKGGALSKKKELIIQILD